MFKKERELTTSERTQVLQAKTREAVSAFQTTFDSLDSINAELLEVIKHDEEEIAIRTANRDKAMNEYLANKSLQEELKRFIPQGE